MALLDAAGISKRFGGIVALEDVSVAVAPGEAVGLVGPNGAGKTTLFDCLDGVRHPDAGEVRFEGRRIDRLALFERARLGIGRTFQRAELFNSLTVRDNVALGREASLAGRSAKPRSCGAKPSNFVVLFALLGVTEHVVRRGDFLELLL